MSQLALYLLGTPRLELDSVPVSVDRRKVFALLAYLALTHHPHRRDHLATLFWPGYDQASARANLRRTLSLLNQSVGSDWLKADRETVALKPSDDLWLDVDRFHQYLTACTTHGHPASEVCTDCLEPLTQAVALYHDDLLTGFTLPDSPEFDDWQLFQAESLRRELAEALEKLARGYGDESEFEPAIAFARRWLALDPLQESAHRHLMRLLTLSGQRNAALAQYDTCRTILADELGLDPTVETDTLYQQIRQATLVAEPIGPALQHTRPPAPRHNLPAQLTPFIGRKQELAEITALLHDEPTCRLLTLVGPGGSGKTRLALQAAVESVDTFPHGVYFVALASISAVESVVPAMAAALSLPLAAGDPHHQLLNYLREKMVLLVLDNFEQLIAMGATDLVSEIALAAPRVKLLVTSRERLNLQEEWGVEVQGMRFPVGNEVVDAESLKTYSAIQLFLQRAFRSRPSFVLSSNNSPDVVRICQLVEGMPLGLELASTWLRMMSCREIVQEIERGLDFLTTSLRDVPERHHSLRAVFEHSWRLLSDDEKAVLGRLSVFRGGFRRRAAERVTDASLLLLSALVDKSLLRRTGASRYEVHELLRQYAAEKLSETPNQNEQTKDRHSEFYLTFFQQRTEELKGSREQAVYYEISTDIDNVRVAWGRAVSQKNFAVLGQSADGLLLFSDYRGWFQEGAAAVEQAKQRLALERQDAKSEANRAVSDLVLAQLLRAEGWFSYRLGNIARGQEILQTSIALLRQAEPVSDKDLALSLYWLSNIYWTKGEYLETKQHAQESLALFAKIGDNWGMGVALFVQGMVATYQGKYQEANRIFLECISYLSEKGEVSFISQSKGFLGVIARLRGEYAQARRYLEESYQTIRRFGDLVHSAYHLRELGYLAIAVGDYSQAEAWMQESAATFRDIDTRLALVFPLDGLGTIARLQGKHQQAEQFHRESLSLCREFEERRGIALCLNNLGLLAYDMQDYPAAEQYLQESLTRYKEIGHQHGVASALCNLGYVLCALGRDRHEEARGFFHRSLEIALKIDTGPVALNGLVGLATLQFTGSPEQAGLKQAVELLALALQHPASEQETKDRADRLLDQLASKLSPESMATALQRGRTRELDTVLLRLLQIQA